MNEIFYWAAGIMTLIVLGAGGWVIYDLIKNGRWWSNESDWKRRRDDD